MSAEKDPLHELRTQYLRSLPRKLREVQKLLAKLEDDPDNQTILDQLWTIIHQIHGTAATFSLRNVMDIAMVWDALLYDVSENEFQHLGNREMSEMASYLGDLNQAAKASLREIPFLSSDVQ